MLKKLTKLGELEAFFWKTVGLVWFCLKGGYASLV